MACSKCAIVVFSKLRRDYSFMFRKTLMSLLGIWLFTAFGVLSFAQSVTSGAVTGTVTDPTGSVVPNAAVTLKKVDTNAEQKSVTNGDGT